MTNGHININLLLDVLRHLHGRKGVATPELCEITGMSRPTMMRLFARAEIDLGVRIG